MAEFQYQYLATCTRVIDGDTIVARVDLGFDVSFLRHFRLARINTPELNSPELAVRAKAQAAKDALISLVMNQPVRIVSMKDRTEKYGRYLGELYLGNLNVNDEMIRLGHSL